MKLNKLLVSSALILVLGLGACNNKKPDGPVEPTSSEQESESSSESQIEPVSRISVSDVPTTVIVGQEINLEDYVTVEGGEGPKVFDLRVPAVSAENVTIDGHKATPIKEGEFSITIVAGQLTAKFSSVAMSVLRAELKELLDATTGCYAAQEFEEAENGSLTLGDLSIHRGDYFAGAKAMEHETGWGPGGMLKAQNGKTYEFLMDDMNGTNFEVLPTVQSDFSHWTFAVDIALDVTVLTYCQDETTGDEWFELDVDDIPLPSGWTSLDNFLDLYGIAIFDTSIGTYVDYYADKQAEYAPITFRKIELANGVETFAVALNFIMSGTLYTITEGYLLVGDDVPEIQVIRDYIDEGNAPAALSFSEAQDKVSAIATEKIYTSTTTAYWYNPKTLEQIEAPANTGYWLDYFGQYFSVGSEVDYVNASTVYQQVTVGETTAVFGDIAHDGALYTFTNMGDSGVGETLNATLVEGSDVWTDKVSDTIGAMNSDALWEGFTPTDRIENEDGSVTIVTDGKNCNLALMTAFLESIYLGYDVNQVGMGLMLTPADGGDSFPAMEYFDLAITVAADSLTIDVGFTWDSTIAYSFSTQYTGIGTDAVPANISDIVYPQA